MNKNEFLRILRENLNGLPADEAESAVRYYSEYIDDAGGSDAVFEELGGLIGVGMFYVCKYEGIGVYKLCRLIFTNGGKK